MTKAAYLGCFAHQVDRRGRVQLPAHWRGAGEAFSLHLVETPVPHLVASRDAQGAGPDPAGRITIPDGLRQAAGIEGDAVLVGLLDRFALWSPSLHQATAQGDTSCTGEILA